MKIQVLLALSAALCFSTAFRDAALPHVDVYQLDTEASTLAWKGKKLTGEHYGDIKFTGGELRDNHGAISGKFEVDMNTIVCNDLKGESKTKLENHLKSEDFFDSKTFPKSTFAITSIKPFAGNADGFTHTVSGNLTIRDKTNPIIFNTKLNPDDNGNLLFEGETVVDRSKFDVKHRSKSFFPDIGDKIIYDEFILVFNVRLVK